MKPNYHDTLAALKVTELLRDVAYEIIGTPPLGIAVENSDIDIACFSVNPQTLAQCLYEALSHCQGRKRRSLSFPPYKTELISLSFMEWDIEFFLQNRPLEEQFGVRHFRLEQRILSILGPEFATQIIQLKHQGIKTEPAFAKLLGLAGDPYLALLDLEKASDQKIKSLLPAPSRR